MSPNAICPKRIDNGGALYQTVCGGLRVWRYWHDSPAATDCGYDTFVELEVDGGNGSVAGYATVTDLGPGRTFWALLDVRKDGEALAGTALADLAESIESAGHTVYTTHPILDSGCGVTGEYNLMFDLDVLSETAYFAWDFSEYDSTLRVANLALGVPEPGTLLLGTLALLLLMGHRRKSPR